MIGIEIHGYEKVYEDIHDLSSLNKKIWISPKSSFAIFNAVLILNNFNQL